LQALIYTQYIVLNTPKYNPMKTTNLVGCSPDQVSILQATVHLYGK